MRYLPAKNLPPQTLPFRFLLALAAGGAAHTRALAAAETLPAEPTVLYDSDRDPFAAWKVYSKDGPTAARVRNKRADASGPALIELSALTGAPMGLNLRVPALKGRVTFEYKVTESSIPKSPFALYAIPMQGRPDATTPPLEVGAKQPGDPSAQRRSSFLPLPAAGSEAWQTVTLEFDFTGLADAGYTIVAPRINEGTPATGPGTIQIRAVRISVLR